MISGDNYGILSRLLLNQPIVPSPEGLLRLLGFVHVYTASGLHLIALEAFLQRILGRTLVSRKILTVFFWFFLIVLWKLQGFRLGFARILILFFLRSLARTSGFRWRVYYPLLIAFCFDFALGIDSGWQHYYLAILGGMLGLELAKNRNVFVQHLYLSSASWLMTAPLDLLHQNTVSWMTPIWSMITIPAISIVLYPMSVISYLVLDRIPDFVLDLWNSGFELLFKIVDLGFTFSVINTHVALISLLLAVLVSLFGGVRLSILGILALLVVRPLLKENQLVQMNVGQGDSLLIQKSDRIEMIDLGTSRDLKPEKILLRLASHGVTRLDTVLFSHLDEDHAGGVKLLLPWVQTTNLEVNSGFARTKKLRNWLEDFPKTKWCETGCFQSGDVDWVGVSGKNEVNGNDLMATAIIPLSKNEVYLALGDADSRMEEEFWMRHHQEIQRFHYRYLKISHHGSRYSSRLDFIQNVNPVKAIVSVGRRNPYHHPHYAVIDELRRERIPVHRTDRSGDFIWNEF